MGLWQKCDKSCFWKNQVNGKKAWNLDEFYVETKIANKIIKIAKFFRSKNFGLVFTKSGPNSSYKYKEIKTSWKDSQDPYKKIKWQNIEEKSEKYFKWKIKAREFANRSKPTKTLPKSCKV